MTPLYVRKHSARLRMVFDRFPANTFKTVDFDNLPAFCFGIISCPLFVMLGTFTPGLVLSRNPNPDANPFDYSAVFRRVSHGFAPLAL